MSERRIQCPKCGGLSRDDDTASLSCSRCGSSGTISDRRKPTANDRAVERIKARCTQEMDADVFHAVSGRFLADIIATIIREEAERGD